MITRLLGVVDKSFLAARGRKGLRIGGRNISLAPPCVVLFPSRRHTELTPAKGLVWTVGALVVGQPRRPSDGVSERSARPAMLLAKLQESLSGDIVRLTVNRLKGGEEVELSGTEHQVYITLGCP